MVSEHHLSERRACRLVGLSRDSYRHPPQVDQATVELHEKIVEIAHVRRRFGYRRIHDLLRRFVIQRLMCNFELSLASVAQGMAVPFREYFAPELKELGAFVADGLVTLEGEAWRSRRSLAQPAFHRQSLERLTQISRFVDVFTTDPVARSFARALGITRERLDGKLRDTINHRLFGPQSAWRASQSGTEGDDTLLEPFFVIEAKALLEHTTGNHGLFSV